jgi:hypothetical protein
MKYVFRRLLAGVVIVPAVAGIYTLICGIGIAFSATGAGATAGDYWNLGLVFGVGVTLAFAISAWFEVRRLND